MGTFHQDKGDLHGITVVVDCPDRVYVGRCDVMTPHFILLHDADEHVDGAEGKSRNDYLKFAAEYGIWKKHDTLKIESSRITGVRKLGELTP